MRPILAAAGLLLATTSSLAPPASACAHLPHTFQFTAATADAPEDASGGEVTLTVSYTGNNSCAPGSVDWATGDGTALPGQDYTAGSGTLDFPAGGGTREIHVAITDDVSEEDDESFTVILSNPRDTAGQLPASLGSASTATVTITDDDAAPPAEDETTGGGQQQAPAQEDKLPPRRTPGPAAALALLAIPAALLPRRRKLL